MEFRVLREVAEVIPGTSPKGEFISSDGLGYPFFQGVKEFGTVYPTPERYTEKPIRLAQSGDILFSVRAPVGRTNIATSDCAIGRGVMAIRPNSSQDRNHLLYFLRSIEDKWDSLGSTGSVFESINVSNLRELNVTWPNNRLEASEILWKLDEKIRVNQQIASMLEQIAQTIFKSWFVDFDPVHAKARGEQPEGMDAETAALFPDSFEDSELGPIPSGWTVKAFGDACNLVMGQSPPGDSYNSDGNGLPFYQGRTDFGDRFPSRRMYTTAGKRIANAGETLISVRAPVGDTNQATEECVIGRGVAAAIHKSGSQVFTYSLLIHLKPQLEYYNGEGTVFGAINRKDFETLSFVEPANAEVSAFEKLLGATNTQIKNLHDQTTSLTSLRDSLLPRLISGELEIPAELLET
jgi:type I restriction enzyme S subunit